MKRNYIHFFICVFLSLILILYCVVTIESTYELNKHDLIVTEASESLAKLKRDSTESFAIQNSLNKFYGLLNEEKYSIKELENKYNDYCNSGYNFINIRLFDNKYNNIDLRNHHKNDVLSSAMQRLYIALAQNKSENNDSNLKKYRSLFETMLGSIDLNQLTKDSSTLIPVNLGGNPGYIYWNVYENQAEKNDLSGILAWVRRSEIPPRFFCQKLVDEYNLESKQNNSNTIFGYIDINSDGYIYPENLSENIPTMKHSELVLKIQELKASLKSHDYFADYIFNYTEISNGKCFFSLSSIEDTFLSKLLTILFAIILLSTTILFCINSLKFIKTLSTIKTEQNLIANKSMNYAILSGIACLIFLYVVNTYIEKLSTRYKIDQIYKNLSAVIDWIDDGYVIAKKELSEKWLNIAQSSDFKEMNLASISKTAENLANNKLIDRMYISDKNGKLIFSYPDKGNDNTFSKFIPIIARKIATERLSNEETWKNRLDDLMMSNVNQSFAELIGDSASVVLKAFENYDTASELELGQKRHLVFSTILNTNDNNPKILITWLDSDNFNKNYIINKIKDSEMLPENIKQINLAMVPIHLDSVPYPPEIAKYSFVRDITNRVTYTKRSVNFETRAGGQDFYGVGALLHSSPKYVVFALYGEINK